MRTTPLFLSMNVGLNGWVLAGSAALLLSACGAPHETVEESVAVSVEPLTICSANSCGETGGLNADGGGRWPSSIIRYKWATTNYLDGGGNIVAMPPTASQKTMIQQAMADWETVTNGIIDFQLVGSGVTAWVNIGYATAGGGAMPLGYNDCAFWHGQPATCRGWLNESNAYHELGHLIGAGNHNWERYDARHYLKSFDTATWSCQSRVSTVPASNGLDYGPFDYYATLQYNVTHPDMARWDGTPLIPGTSCSQVGAGRQPVSFYSATCTTCAQLQPNGFPTPGDASRVVEHYQWSAWKKFLRTVEEDTGAGIGKPYDWSIATNVRVSSTASPAVETWEGGNLAIYARGFNTSTGAYAIYKKWFNVSTNKWMPWDPAFPNPAASGTLSDPAVTSWGVGRIDLAVRQGTSVYIKTYSSGSWGGWGSLGAPSGATPASAPSITSWGTNRIDVFVRGDDDRLYTRKCTANCVGTSGTWSSWSVVGTGTFRGKPSAVSRAANIIDVFMHGMDDELWGVQNLSDTWSNWYKVPTTGTLKYSSSCPDCYSPAAGSRGSESLDVYIRGQDDKLWITTWTGGNNWTGYSALGGVLSSSPGTPSRVRATDRADVVVSMAEEYLANDLRYGMWLKKFEP